MNPEQASNVMAAAAALCAGGAAFSLAAFSLGAYRRYRAEGWRLDRGLLYDSVAERSRLPVLFRAYKQGVIFLPLVRWLAARGAFGIRGRLRDYERLLVKAGLRPYMTPEHLLSLFFVSGLACGLLIAAFPVVLGIGPVAAVLAFLMGGVAGLPLPAYMLNQLAAERASLIEKRLPYATGFILLAMEANASLPMAIKSYYEEMENDPLADELRIVVADIEQGLNTQEALASLDERVRVDLLSSFILAVNTGLATGQPIQDIMRVQADVTRRKRYDSAEEIAKKASTKATFPLVLIVIAVLLLLIGPLLLNLSTSFL